MENCAFRNTKKKEFKYWPPSSIKAYYTSKEGQCNYYIHKVFKYLPSNLIIIIWHHIQLHHILSELHDIKNGNNKCLS